MVRSQDGNEAESNCNWDNASSAVENVERSDRNTALSASRLRKQKYVSASDASFLAMIRSKDCSNPIPPMQLWLPDRNGSASKPFFVL